MNRADGRVRQGLMGLDFMEKRIPMRKLKYLQKVGNEFAGGLRGRVWEGNRGVSDN